MVAIAAAVLVTFIGGLYFITHHKKEESETLQSQKVTGNGLPPKPEERWRYIKELESRQPGVRAPTEPSAGGEVKTPEQLTPNNVSFLNKCRLICASSQRSWLKFLGMNRRRNSVSKRYSANVRRSN
ncbi:hypothetical protein ACLB1O_22815 [Escherichia coli]